MNKPNMYKKSVIFTGGECDTSLIDLRELIPSPSETLIIAADSGYHTAKKSGITPDLIIGDMDSIEIIPEEIIEIIKANPEKDATDTMLAVETAVSRGAEEILIIGGTGGRCDHTLSNIFLLESLSDRNIKSAITDGRNHIQILKNSSATLKKRGYRYFSILSLSTSTVSVSGCRYPLTNAKIKRTNPYAVSNEITTQTAEITVSGAPIIIIESEKTSNTI